MTDRQLMILALAALDASVDTRRCSISIRRTMNMLRARLSEPEVKREPMSLAEIHHAIGDREQYVEIVRAVEAHHGIK